MKRLPRPAPSRSTIAGFAATVLSGLLLAGSQAPYQAGILSFIALVPYLLAFEARLARGSVRMRRELLYGYVMGVAGFGAMLYWVAFLPPDEMAYSSMRFPAAVALTLYQALYPLLFAAMLVAMRSRGRVPLFIAAPLAWTAAEWLRGSGPLAFPWGCIGYSLSPYPAAIQMAAGIGVLGLSAWIMLVNALTACAVRARRGATGLESFAVAAILFVTVPLIYGAFVLRHATPSGRSITVALVQPNVGGVEKWRKDFSDWNLGILDSMTVAAGARGADLIVWPETAATSYIRFDHAYAEKIYAAVRSAGKPLIAGFLDAERDRPQHYRTFNAAGLIYPGGMIGATYRKMHLVPFGEVMPFQEWIPPLRHLDLGEADFDAGDKPVLLEVGGLKAGVMICFEAIFPGVGRRLISSGANLLVNITNDSWFGDSPAPYQHAEMSIMRAVELRRSLARCANTGISMIVDPWGRVTARSGVFTQEIVTGTVQLRDGSTVFARWGGFFDVAWPIAAMLVVIGSVARARRNRGAPAAVHGMTPVTAPRRDVTVAPGR